VHLQHIRIGHNMNNNEKIEILNRYLESMSHHILTLQNDISENPSADIKEKPLRSQVLLDFIKQKEAIETEIGTLTNRG
jgi:hypothetical protein